MPEPRRSIVRAARDLQSAVNRLAYATRHQDRDSILAVLYADEGKGRAAQGRLDAQAPVIAALETEAARLREELGAMLDNVLPGPLEPPELTFTEPPTKRRKRK